MKKTILLEDTVEVKGKPIARMITRLEGDGATPLVQTTGTGDIVGYSDNGQPILDDDRKKAIEKAHQTFMAEAIKEQKKLSKENGINPDVVNMFDAEKSEN